LSLGTELAKALNAVMSAYNERKHTMAVTDNRRSRTSFFAFLGIHAPACLDSQLIFRLYQTAQTVLDHWPKIAIITGKQIASVQSNLETYLDLWCTTAGISI